MTQYIKTIADKLVRSPSENAGNRRPDNGRKRDAVAYAAALEILG